MPISIYLYHIYPIHIIYTLRWWFHLGSAYLHIFISYTLSYVLNTQFRYKQLSFAGFVIVAKDGLYLVLWHQHICDVTRNVGYWHCDIIFVDCCCTHKLKQKRSSLVNVDFSPPRPGIHGLACKNTQLLELATRTRLYRNVLMKVSPENLWVQEIVQMTTLRVSISWSAVKTHSRVWAIFEYFPLIFVFRRRTYIVKYLHVVLGVRELSAIVFHCVSMLRSLGIFSNTPNVSKDQENVAKCGYRFWPISVHLTIPTSRRPIIFVFTLPNIDSVLGKCSLLQNSSWHLWCKQWWIH